MAVSSTEFAEHSGAFFEQVRQGRFKPVASPQVEDELEPAPQAVRDLFAGLLPIVEMVRLTPDVVALRRAYIEADILSVRSESDAMHVAAAAVAGCDILVSWNFRHIVHIDKGPKYNAVNALRNRFGRGYRGRRSRPDPKSHAPTWLCDGGFV